MNDQLATCAIAIALAPAADRYNANPATDVMSMKEYRGLRWVINEGAGTTGTVVVTVEECTANDGTGATAIPFRYRLDRGEWTAATASGYTVPAGGDQIVEIDVQVQDLSDGSPFVRLQLTEGVDAPTVAGVTVIAYGARYADETPVTPVG